MASLQWNEQVGGKEEEKKRRHVLRSREELLARVKKENKRKIWPAAYFLLSTSAEEKKKGDGKAKPHTFLQSARRRPHHACTLVLLERGGKKKRGKKITIQEPRPVEKGPSLVIKSCLLCRGKGKEWKKKGKKKKKETSPLSQEAGKSVARWGGKKHHFLVVHRGRKQRGRKREKKGFGFFLFSIPRYSPPCDKRGKKEKKERNPRYSPSPISL